MVFRRRNVRAYFIVRYSYHGDGIVSALQVLQAVITIGDNLADFIADLQLMPQLLKTSPYFPGKNWPINEKFKNVQKRVLDKLGSDGRILVRASGTEPVHTGNGRGRN
ncbi:MAG: hypothetical protein CM15mP58_00360 [Burkholderiaceae bacterium]|nr:MAG: hypothetical protein CM15mP58_00360 [Burkholderiaceae bacterium]